MLIINENLGRYIGYGAGGYFAGRLVGQLASPYVAPDVHPVFGGLIGGVLGLGAGTYLASRGPVAQIPIDNSNFPKVKKK